MDCWDRWPPNHCLWMTRTLYYTWHMNEYLHAFSLWCKKLMFIKSSYTITFTSEHPISIFFTLPSTHRHSIPETSTSIFFILHNSIPLWLLLHSFLSSMYATVHTVNSYDHFICTMYDIHWTWVWYLMWTGVVSVSVTVRVQNWSDVCEWCV